MADPKPATIERPSLRNRIWRLRNEQTVGAMGTGESMLRYVLRRRGLEGEAAAAFLNSRVSAEMPDPYTLKDMDKVVGRLADAVERREKVGIFGDYDVDGATSTAIMLRYLHFAGLNGQDGPEAIYHIPHRIVEGYGPNAKSLLRMQADGCTVIICLDSGTTAFEPLDAATKAGLDMLVVDHHAAKPMLPNVIGVVNPNRLDEKDGAPGGKFGYMCAAGLTFMTVYALNGELKRRGFFKDGEPPRLTRLLQLAALGTVADVVPLVGLNRALVTMGLKVMNEIPYIGIFKMAETARMAKKAAGAKIEMDDPYEFDAYSCGFLFGPRINAGGRIADQLAGAKLLSINDDEQAQAIATELEKANDDRKLMCETAVNEAMQIVMARMMNHPVLIVTSDTWHPGIIGIVAGRLKETFDRPVYVITFDDKGMGKCSARSIPGWDIGAHTIAAYEAGLLVHGGGHPMAAGLSILRDKLDAFFDFILARAGNLGVNETAIDGVLPVGLYDAGEVDELAALQPFGQGNDEPRFVIKDALIKYVDADKKSGKHYFFTLEGRDGAKMKAKLWYGVGTALGEGLAAGRGSRFDVLGRLKTNFFRDVSSVELNIEDARVILD